jgi:hypothetical protein
MMVAWASTAYDFSAAVIRIREMRILGSAKLCRHEITTDYHRIAPRKPHHSCVIRQLSGSSCQPARSNSTTGSLMVIG